MNMDILYQDFTQKLLPKIQEGLVITKDYFKDLFSRYVHYLIVMDGLSVLCGIVLLVIGVIFGVKTYRAPSTGYTYHDGSQEFGLAKSMFLGISLVALSIGLILEIYGVENLVKDIYIPEVRVYQELSPLIK